jgi:hypothetical protein
MVRRKSISSVSGINTNKEDRDAIITLLLKRHCSFEEAADYLLSAILEQTKDDILGELAQWEASKKRTP